MSNLRGEALYRAAFERLKEGKGEIVNTSDPDFRFTTTTVAKEAGKGKGFIRASRFHELCKEIEEQEEVRLLKSSERTKPSKKKASPDDRVKKLSEQYEALKSEHEACLEKMLNLIKSNYELQKENKYLKAQSNIIDISSRSS